MEEKLYYSRKEAAEYISNLGLPCSPKTLAKYAVTGESSPAFKRFGSRRVVYEKTALDTWVNNKLSQSFSNTTQADTSLREV